MNTSVAPAHLGVRERWLTAGLLGMGLVAFAVGPMIPVLLQRVLGFEPLLVAWTMLPANIVYGLTVLLAGRLSDRVSAQALVIGGLIMYAATFFGYAGINELTTAVVVTMFLT